VAVKSKLFIDKLSQPILSIYDQNYAIGNDFKKISYLSQFLAFSYLAQRTTFCSQKSPVLKGFFAVLILLRLPV